MGKNIGEMFLAGFGLTGKDSPTLSRELEKIFSILPFGIVYLDTEFRFLNANSFFRKFIGMDNKGRLEGKPCYETFGEYADDDSKKGRQKICSFCKKEEVFRNKKPTVLERPLGDKFIRVTTVPEMDGEGNIFRFLEVVEDITDRRQAEDKLCQKDELYKALLESSPN
jgi:PAS domain S-box-containing protein